MFGEEFDAGAAALGNAEAGGLDAAEAELGFLHGGDEVDVGKPNLGAFQERHGPAEVAGVDGGGEAELDVVGDGDGAVEVGGFHQAKDGSEDFLAGDAHVWGDAGEEGGFEETAVVEAWAGEAFSAGGECGAFGLADLHIGEDALELGVAADGAHGGGGVGAVADLDFGDAVEEQAEELLCGGALDNDAACGGAPLAGAGVGGGGGAVGGGLEIGVGEDDEGVLAAELELGAGHDGGGAGLDLASDIGGPGERDGLDAGVGEDGVAHGGAAAGDEVEDARGQAGVGEEPGELVADAGGEAGGFEDAGVAGHEGGGAFAARDVEGEVPGADDGGDAEGPAEAEGHDAVVGGGQDFALEAEAFLDLPIHFADGGVDFGEGFLEGLAVFCGEDGGDGLAAIAHQVEGLGEEGGALVRGEAAPGGEGGGGGVDGAGAVFASGGGPEAGDFGEARGVALFEGCGGVNPASADEIGEGFGIHEGDGD